jgi:hypothetical protein
VRRVLINTLHDKGKTKKIDIFDYMYNEILLRVIWEEVLHLCPYIQVLIEDVIGVPMAKKLLQAIIKPIRYLFQ